jgi:intracellular sulfur oxidation DsrE/DsrF family protein
MVKFLEITQESITQEGKMIKHYGFIHELPNAAVQPDPNLEYKIVYSITKPAEKQAHPNPGLVHIARTINLYEWAGIAVGQMRLAGVVHGPATPIVLSNPVYQQEFGYDNPDLDLIDQLSQAGVELFICGQSLLGYGYERDALASGVTFALSALTVLPTYQLKGYALLNY